MTEEKQIEEMAKDICLATQKTNYRCYDICKKQGGCTYCIVMAEHLYAAGCRKQIEGEWIKDERSKFVHRYHCSACNFRLLGAPTKYCEDCGAKMKGGE